MPRLPAGGGLAHADLHWFVPIPRPKAADPDKAVEEAAQALAEVMEERRTQPLYGPPDGMASHSMASVRLLHRQAALTAVEGGRRVFILGDAERLVPQESSQEAANALLKLLEEPPVGSAVHPDGGRPAPAAADDPVARGAGPAQPADGRAGARTS